MPRQIILANDAGFEALKAQCPRSPQSSVFDIGAIYGIPIYRAPHLVATEVRSNCRFCEFDKSDNWAIEAGLARIVELPGEPVVMLVDAGKYRAGVLQRLERSILQGEPAPC